ncbi:hypothetical protein ACET3X_007597 [Alternaria dauci]|uniref:Uncharacterized protein n=1 Tax=Alternaria dauci TaxID=48095 RepID=A0ABR3UCF0_9PLEO
MWRRITSAAQFRLPGPAPPCINSSAAININTRPSSNAQTGESYAYGPFTINIAAESSTPQADPGRPRFLKGVTFHPDREMEWKCTVLPYIRLLTFTVASTTDTFFMGALLKALPGIANNILRVDMKGFHWFSGISDNRKSNPFMILASNLPSLEELSFTLHTSTITDSMWGERQLLELERTKPNKAKERRVRTVAEVVGRYGMEQIFRSSALEHVRLVYIKSEMVTPFVVQGKPEVVLENIRRWLVQGFKQHGRDVVVELSLAA